LTAFFGCLYYAALRPEEAVALRLPDCHLPGSRSGACCGCPRPRPGPLPPGPAAAPAMNSAGSSTGQTGRSGWSRSLGCWPPCSVPTTRLTAPHPTAGCSGEPRRTAQRIGLRPRLAIRPHARPRYRASRQRARPAPLRSAPRLLVTVAE
jgi:hypothetical protein